MSKPTKIFDYQVNGLSYTVTIYEKDGAFFADITVDEGSMDVNAIYFGDDSFSGASASLKGPLNMNGGGSQYEGAAVQWDDAVKLSDPGLGKAGTGKETFVSQGETLTVPLDIQSLDEIDFFGIRATSTTTAEGSIKAVSGDPETTEDPDEPDEEPTFEKVFFAYALDGSGTPSSGYSIQAAALPEGTEPTFENYVSYFEGIGGLAEETQSVVFYDIDERGDPQELFRIDAPEGGFADSDALLAAYDDAIEGMEAEDLMVVLTLDSDQQDEPVEDEPEEAQPLWAM